MATRLLSAHQQINRNSHQEHTVFGTTQNQTKANKVKEKYTNMALAPRPHAPWHFAPAPWTPAPQDPWHPTP